jgi:class 3 adenylate cyclase
MTATTTAHSLKEAFINRRREPCLVKCVVLFMDLLGVSAMNQARHPDRYLVALERVVTKSYRDYLNPFSPWPSAFFSDTLVVAAPLVDGRSATSEVMQLAAQGAELQMDLARAGFFARGGLSIGKFHIRDGLVFGPALVEAYRLESQIATHPRIVLSADAAKCQLEAQRRTSRGNPMLMRDGDGWTFINYLGAQIEVDPQDPIQALAEHRDQIVVNLIEHRSAKRVWEKYRWVAEYHNEVLREKLPGDQSLLVPADPMTWGFSPFG